MKRLQDSNEIKNKDVENAVDLLMETAGTADWKLPELLTGNYWNCCEELL